MPLFRQAQGEPTNAAPHTGEFLIGHDPVGIGFSLIMKVGCGNMSQSFDQSAEAAKAGGEPVVHEGVGSPAGDVTALSCRVIGLAPQKFSESEMNAIIKIYWPNSYNM